MYAAPLELTSQNTDVHFEVDSTWHLVKGKASKISGAVYRDSSSEIQGEVRIPVASLTTDSAMRDRKMLVVMGAPTFSEIVFRVTALEGLTAAVVNGYGPLQIHGNLSIREITKPVILSGTLATQPNGALDVNGTTTISWADYGVEDPSIFIAKLSPTVNISFTLHLPSLP